jgi:phospholipid/cholesterol/gamma-HCH transport system permease protein
MKTTSFDRKIEGFLFELTDMFRFIGLFFRNLFSKRFERDEFVNQLYKTGYRSFFLISVTGLILGLVLTLQTRPMMADLGAESWLPNLVFVSIIREMSPVIMALLFAGKVGSGIGAELSSMRVTEQIDAMEVSATGPVNYLVVTRVLATTIMLPVLVFYADFIAFMGSFLALKAYSNISFPLFFAQAFDGIYFYDIIPATIKTFFFGFFIGIISCYKGYFANRGTEGVGQAANASVVISSMVIFIIDLVAVQITSLFEI